MRKSEVPGWESVRNQLKRRINKGDLSSDGLVHWKDELRVIEHKLIDAGSSIRITRWNK
jgi:hypothetical protein